MIKKYTDFVDYNDFILESNIVYSSNFKRIISKIDSPLTKRILDVEDKDFPVSSNFFDLSVDKNDTITFTPDKKASEIMGDSKEIVRHTGGGLLKHSESNSSMFEKLGYIPLGPSGYTPESSEVGEVVSKAVSDISSKTYVFVKFPGGQAVINEDNLREASTPSDKIGKVWKSNRQEIKVGRAIRALLRSVGDGAVSNKEIEQFTNLFKSEIDKSNDKFRFFDIVKGNDIAYWYNSDRYLEIRGTIGSSCMSKVPSKWLEIYTSNPDSVNLVIFKSEKDDTKIVGRSLLWMLDDGKKFMDRIYTINDSDVELFRSYAKENGFYAKQSNSSTDSGYSYDPNGANGSTVELELVVTFKKGVNYGNYPYLDTLKYYNPNTGVISNSSDGGCLSLESANGHDDEYEDSCETCGGEGRIECRECDGSGTIRRECDNCNGYGKYDCRECDGEGEVDNPNYDPDDEDNTEDEKTKCPDCDGDGKKECDECDGDGEIDADCYECDGRGRTSCPDC